MLHMIVSTHNPESCAYRGEDEDHVLTAAIEGFRGSAPEKDIAIQGWWINRPVHEFFILADAPNAHVIEEALTESGMVGRTHTRVLPVNEVEAIMEAPPEKA